MSQAAMDALRAEHAHALELFDSLTADEWARASGCAGWRVQDVAQHMAATFHMIADRTSIELGTSGQTETDAEVPVQARRDWTPAQVCAEYREWSDKGIAALAAMQDEPLAEMVAPLGDLGSHPLHTVANAIVFDHYCHLRHDIGAAVRRAADLPHDPLALECSIEWMMAGLPQMCAAALEPCRVGVNLVFTDLQHVSYRLVRAPGDGPWEVHVGTDNSHPVAVTSAHEFVSWGTKRSDWRAHTQLSDQAAAATLDAFDII